MNPTNKTYKLFISKTKQFLLDCKKSLNKTGLIEVAKKFITSGILIPDDIFIIHKIMNNEITISFSNILHKTLYIYTSPSTQIEISICSFIKYNLFHRDSIRVVMPGSEYIAQSKFNLNIYVLTNGQKTLPHLTIDNKVQQIYSAGYIERICDGFNADELPPFATQISLNIQQPLFEFLKIFYADSFKTGLRHKKK